MWSAVALCLTVGLVPQAQEEPARSARPVVEEAGPDLEGTYTDRHALVVGIDHYQDVGYPDLSFAVKDARAVAELLVKRYGFPQENVRLVAEKDATRDALVTALEEWACDAARIGENDLFVLFFAGHGVTREAGAAGPGHGGRAGYLVPVDGRTRKGDPAWGTLLSMDRVQQVSEFIRAKHAVFILDCCFGGLVADRAPLPLAAGLKNRARQVMTAGTKDQTVQDGGGGGHSVFTAALLDGLGALADGNADKIVTFGELYNYVGRRVEGETSARQTPIQAELADHGGGSVAFFSPDVRPAEMTAQERLRALEQSDKEKAQEIERLSDLVTLGDLQAQADDLWPRRPGRAPTMRHWLGRARDLLDRLPDHQESLQRIRQQAYLSQVVAGVIEEAEGSQVVIEKLNPKLRWRLESFSKLVSGLAELEKLVADVAGRLEMAETIEQRTVEEHADEWALAIEEIEESPWYGGLKLETQPGLVPLEADPESELQEFWVWETGERPERDEERGGRKIEAETGMVLVLIPGGTFWMGATRDPAGPDDDPQAESDESPVHQVTLDPFFLSKYEMTQGQWERIMGENPSLYREGKLGGPTHPVEQVDWTMCRQACARAGLLLPTEAQWEYACRAGTDTPWWTGKEASSLEGAANLFDRESPQRNPETKSWGIPESWGDPYTVHAPVGSFPPNPWGLHDVHGNVWEWCRDGYASYGKLHHRPGDGLLETPGEAGPPLHRVNRGGSFYAPALNARSAIRIIVSPVYRYFSLGCRPAARVITE